MNMLKFIGGISKLVKDLNDFWSEITTIGKMDSREYSKKIDGFIKQLEELKNG